MKRVRFLVVASTVAATLGLTSMITASSQASELPTLKVALSKNKVTVSGQTVSGAVNVEATVSGEPLDNAGLLRLKPGVTASDLLKGVEHLGETSDLDAIDHYGTIVLDGQDAPKGAVTDTQGVLPAGNYVVLSDGSGHASFTVKQSPSPASLPNPQAVLDMIDFGFTGATTLHDGELVRFANHGYLLHMVQAARVASTTTAAEAEADLSDGNTAAGQKLALAPVSMWTAPLSPGQQEQYVFNAPPGVYVVFCSLYTQTGREQYELAMYKTITVVK